MKILKPIFVLLIAILVIFVASRFYQNKNKQQKTIVKITVGMGYIPNIQFAPFYWALEKGYFQEAGLSLDFKYGFDTDIIKLLANDQLDIGIGSGDQVILARDQGLAIVDFYNWYRRFPVSITSLSSKNITKPEDLLGKKVGLPVNFGASYIGWQAFIAKTRLDTLRIDMPTIGYTQVAALAGGKVDAAVTYRMNEPVQLAQEGFPVNNIDIAPLANLVSNGLLTSEKTIKERPQIPRAFARAFSQGLQEVIANPDQALAISQKYIPNLTGKNLDLARAVLNESIKFWQADKLGENSPQAWQESVDILESLKMIKNKPPLNSLYTNQFVP